MCPRLDELGGFVKQYQVNIDPNRRGVQHPAHEGCRGGAGEQPRRGGTRGRNVRHRIHDAGTRLYKECSGHRKHRCRHQRRGNADNRKGTLQRSRPGQIRRGVADLNGKGEVAGGIVIVRFGENVLNVIERVKEKITKDIEPSLPKKA